MVFTHGVLFPSARTWLDSYLVGCGEGTSRGHQKPPDHDIVTTGFTVHLARFSQDSKPHRCALRI